VIPVKRCIILAIIGSSLAVCAQSRSDVYNGHRGINFDSGWKFNLGDVNGAQSTGFNDASWRTLNLPHDWSIELPVNPNSAGGGAGGYLDGGIGWYRKSFTTPPNAAGKRVFIEFDGVYMNSSVYINGTLLGTRPYGYSTFEYELTPYLNSGSTPNVIAVTANNNQPTSRWYSGSGIYRNVWLTTLNAVHVANCGVIISTPSISSGSAIVAVSTLVQNQSTAVVPAVVTATITDEAGVVVASATAPAATVPADSQTTVNQNLTVANPHRWSTASPYRYTAAVAVAVNSAPVDTYTTHFGIRTIRFDPNTGFYCNEQGQRLYGIAMHHDFGAMGAAINRSIIIRQLSLLKGMGCTAIRTSHNPPAPEFIDLCDSMGLMVMEEAFDCWETGKNTNDYHLYFPQWGTTDLGDMVRRDRNHPSVIMWSIGNEIPGATVATAQNLYNRVRLFDTTRPITWAYNLIGSTIANQVAAVLDLDGYNYGTWLYTADHATYPSRCIFGSETVAARKSRETYVFPDTTIFGNLNPDIGSGYDNSNNSFSPITAEQDMKEHQSRAYVAGEFVWTGFDYLGECTWPCISHNSGMFDRCGFPKDIYYFYRSQWTTAPMVHILPHWNWNAGDQYYTAPTPVSNSTVNLDSGVVGAGFTVPVRVYTNCDSVELFLNNQSLGVQKFQSGGALHLAWRVPFTAGTLTAIGRRGGAVAASDSVKTAGAPARIALAADRTTVSADGEGLVFIEADLVDTNGTVNPRADNPINFTITGPGTIVGVDNGNSTDHAAYKAAARQAFNGKCLAIVQVGTASGLITVTATSDGLAAGTAGISVVPLTGIIARPLPQRSLLAAAREWTVAITGDRFTLPEGTALPVRIAAYSLAGRLVWSGVAATRSVMVNRKNGARLQDGIYIVKILQGRP
jgi:beta-galactosidase